MKTFSLPLEPEHMWLDRIYITKFVRKKMNMSQSIKQPPIKEKIWKQKFTLHDAKMDDEPYINFEPDTGQRLADARNNLNLSISDVAEALKLSEEIISAIENRQYSLMFGLAYATGYVRSYASLVKLDPDDLIHNDPDLGVQAITENNFDLSVLRPITDYNHQFTSRVAITVRTVVVISLFTLAVVGWNKRDDISLWWNERLKTENTLEIQESPPNELEKKSSELGVIHDTRISQS